MFLRFSDCRSMNRADGELKLAALRHTCSSGAEPLEEDMLDNSGMSAREAISFLTILLQKQNLCWDHVCPQWALDLQHELPYKRGICWRSGP